MGRWAQAQRRGSVRAGETIAVLPPPDPAFLEFIEAPDAGAAQFEYGGSAVSQFLTIEAQDTILLDPAYDTGEPAPATITVTGIPGYLGVGTQTLRARMAWSNSDGSVLLSAWSVSKDFEGV